MLQDECEWEHTSISSWKFLNSSWNYERSIMLQCFRMNNMKHSSGVIYVKVWSIEWWVHDSMFQCSMSKNIEILRENHLTSKNSWNIRQFKTENIPKLRLAKSFTSVTCRIILTTLKHLWLVILLLSWYPRFEILKKN